MPRKTKNFNSLGANETNRKQTMLVITTNITLWLYFMLLKKSGIIIRIMNPGIISANKTAPNYYKENKFFKVSIILSYDYVMHTG